MGKQEKKRQPGDIRRHAPGTTEYQAVVDSVQADIRGIAENEFEAPLCAKAGITPDQLRALIDEFGVAAVHDAIEKGGHSYRLALEGYPFPPPPNADWVPD